MIQEQGSFAAGGKVITTPGTFDPRTPTNPAGQTLHGDHAYVFYQIPVNQPRRGDAGRSTQETTVSAATDDQLWFGNFRVGNWPDFFEGVQFPRDAESLNQYFRQMTPNTGPFDVQVVSDARAALFDRVGPGIMVTHSQGGGGGWFTAIKSENGPSHSII